MIFNQPNIDISKPNTSEEEKERSSEDQSTKASPSDIILKVVPHSISSNTSNKIWDQIILPKSSLESQNQLHWKDKVIQSKNDQRNLSTRTDVLNKTISRAIKRYYTCEVGDQYHFWNNIKSPKTIECCEKLDKVFICICFISSSY